MWINNDWPEGSWAISEHSTPQRFTHISDTFKFRLMMLFPHFSKVGNKVKCIWSNKFNLSNTNKGRYKNEDWRFVSMRFVGYLSSLLVYLNCRLQNKNKTNSQHTDKSTQNFRYNKKIASLAKNQLLPEWKMSHIYATGHKLAKFFINCGNNSSSSYYF